MSAEKPFVYRDAEPYPRYRPCDAGEGMRIFPRNKQAKRERSSGDVMDTEPVNDAAGGD